MFAVAPVFAYRPAPKENRIATIMFMLIAAKGSGKIAPIVRPIAQPTKPVNSKIAMKLKKPKKPMTGNPKNQMTVNVIMTG